MGRKKGFRIPGVSFSPSRALGISRLKQRLAKETGIPTTRSGMERKIGRAAMGQGCLFALCALLGSALLGAAGLSLLLLHL